MLSINSKSFADVCQRNFGRKVMYSTAEKITRENVALELSRALAVHWQNRAEIDYLDSYYRGDQPILYRRKTVRPEINNKIVENHAFEFVEFKTAQNFGEPIQYVRRGVDESKSDSIIKLNDYMYSEDKGECDTEIGRWRSICGTAYRFIYMDGAKTDFDEAPFGIECLDPRETGVVYSAGDGKLPLFAFLVRKDENGQQYYVVFTKTQRFEIINGQIRHESKNGMLDVPIIEYPNNSRRLSDIEMVISMTDALNKVSSDRMNGIEQFIQAFIKFVNCEIDEETFINMCQLGALSVKGNADGRNADVDIMSEELDQQQTQTVKDDLYDTMLKILGMPSREQNTGGDTGQAVYLRNGWDFAEQRAEINEPTLEKAEKRFLKIALRTLDIKRNLGLKISDIEIKITRSKMDNMSVKANTLVLLLQAGIDYQVAIKTISLWSDPEEVFVKSRERMAQIYGTTEKTEA